MAKFWMIWRVGGGEPTYRHPSQHLAVLEAERLARANPGCIFYLLEATMEVKLPLQALEWHQFKEDEIPF